MTVLGQGWTSRCNRLAENTGLIDKLNKEEEKLQERKKTLYDLINEGSEVIKTNTEVTDENTKAAKKNKDTKKEMTELEKQNFEWSRKMEEKTKERIAQEEYLTTKQQERQQDRIDQYEEEEELAEALNARSIALMRKNGKTDKEIELAVMKTIVAFLNTVGGILLVGVGDGGNIIGIEKDGFRNNDKLLLHFNNLIKNHIGLEFAGLIDFQLYDCRGKQILAVKCESSPEPVFLKYDEEEDYYIRLGPGSRKLSTRKAIKYINSRKEEQK